jgi:hypothetical protein
MSLRLVTAVLVALAAASSPALACKGASLMFTDDFKTEDPAWQPYGDWISFSISGGKAQLKSRPGSYALATYQGFFLDSADTCVDVIAPDVKDPATVCAGLMFGGVGNDFYVFFVRPNGHGAVYRNQNGGWLTPVPDKVADGAKTGPGVSNTLRVTWKNLAAQLYVNDKPFANTKTLPISNGKFGLYAEPEAGVAQFANMKITAAP